MEARTEVLVSETPDTVAEATSRRIAEMVSSAKGRFSLGIAGGTTPRATYRALRGRASGWQNVDAWLSDERWVPPGDERSNGLMAAQALFDHVDAEFYRPRWSEYMTPEDSAAHYEATLRSIHADRRPDLILLGLGEDGHTASLFPDTMALAEDHRWYVANEVEQLGEDRLTATYPLLWRSQRIMMIVVGESKAQAVKSSFEGKTPAGQLDQGDAVVEWYLDQGSASLLG
ncbi:MAG: 6-phosphogluconolactonase [Acidimicrobiia bacterium]